MSTVISLSPADAAQRCEHNADIVLLDVRTPGEFAALHAQGAVNLPLDRITPDAIDRQLGSVKSAVFICQSGVRATKACEQASRMPLDTIYHVEGGTTAWMQAGLPVVCGTGTISMERQVRIAAGALVVLGSLMGILIHPGWLGIPLFVGMGLMFAGITNTCGMAMLLTHCPWNHKTT